MGYGKELKKILDSRKTSVAWLSKKSKIPATTLYSIIANDSLPNGKTLAKISEALGIATDELISGDPSNPIPNKEEMELALEKLKTITTAGLSLGVETKNTATALASCARETAKAPQPLAQNAANILAAAVDVASNTSNLLETTNKLKEMLIQDYESITDIGERIKINEYVRQKAIEYQQKKEDSSK